MQKNHRQDNKKFYLKIIQFNLIDILVYFFDFSVFITMLQIFFEVR